MNNMKISDPSAQEVLNEYELILAELPFSGACVLELGCGKAEKTRSIAQAVELSSIVALEVDAIQHARNLASEAPSTVTFAQGGAEAIPAADNSFDIVMMFKSLHHVPIEQMDKALDEIRRVLKPGGHAWISEPVFAGDFNEIIRLFHDEKLVREAAFAAIGKAVGDGRLTLEKQLFFSTRGHYDSFEQFDERIIKVTHTNHQLSPALYQAVRDKFMAHMTPDGANFLNPLRVDLLKKI